MMARSSKWRLAAGVLLLFAFHEAAFAQYGGPSILSRGGNQPGRRGQAPVNFTGYLGAGYRYESGLIIPTRAVGGSVPANSDWGYGVEGGLYGGHDWRRQSVGLDYRGDYRWQQQQTFYAGTNHVIAFDYVMHPTRRIQFVLREAGGSTNRALGSFAAPTTPDSSRLGVPLAELFDVRTYFAQSGAAVGWMKSPRLVLTFSGDVFFIKRQSLALINSQGYDARVNAMYRLNRSWFAGGEYQYYRFDFPHAYSGTEAQGPALRVRKILTRRLSVEALAGILRLNSFGVEQVKLSPEVAEILGRSTTAASFVRNTYAPNFEMNALLQQQRGAFRASYSTGVGAGNGIYLATTRHAVGGGYSYTGIRRSSLGVSASWTRSSSASLELPAFQSWQTGFAASYRVAEGLNFTAQIDYRGLANLATDARRGVAVVINMNYTTSRLPLSIW